MIPFFHIQKVKQRLAKLAMNKNMQALKATASLTASPIVIQKPRCASVFVPAFIIDKRTERISQINEKALLRTYGYILGAPYSWHQIPNIKKYQSVAHFGQRFQTDLLYRWYTPNNVKC